MRDKRIDKIMLTNADFRCLSQSFKKGKIGSSYIFATTDGTLSQTLLELLLCNYYCDDEDSDGPCLKCVNCNKILNRTHIDVEYFGLGQNIIKKDEIRLMLDNAITRPFESAHKFLIVENAHNLSELVQNLLLKTLEDIPSFVTIILVTQTLSKILPTIKSRCQTYQLKPMARQDLIRLLGSTEKALHMVDVADGMLSKALQFSNASASFDDRYKFALNLLHNFTSSADLGKHASYLIVRKDSFREILELCQSVFYLAMKQKIPNMVDNKILANMVLLCNECVNLLDKNILFNIVVDKFLLGILKCKVGG